MTTYSKLTDFASKDALLTGNPAKIVKGVEIDDEFNAIATADATSVKGPIGATVDNTVARWDGTTGRLVQGSGVTISDADVLTTPTLSVTGNTTLGDASTDTVTVNGYMGVGGAGNAGYGVNVVSTALTGSSQYGVVANPTFTAAATANATAVAANPMTAASATTHVNIHGIRAFDATKGAGSTITNLHGVYVNDQTQGTNNYGITSLVSSGTNKWNIYASGTAANYFAGNVGIGTAASDSAWSSTKVLNVGRLGNSVFGTTNDDEINIGANVINTGSGAYIYGATDTASLYRQVAAQHVWYYAGSGTAGAALTLTEAMRIDSSGNVGIGTSSPGNFNGVVKLVVGSAATTATAGAITVYSGTATYGGLYFADGTTGNQLYRGAVEYNHSSDALLLYSAGAERARIDSAGNLGLGVTPSNWGANSGAIQAPYGNICGNNSIAISANQYYNAGSKYVVSAVAATQYLQNAGAHQWFTAPSGTAGNVIAWTQAMTLDASGNLGLGVTPGSGTTGGLYLKSNGNISFGGAVSYYDTNAAYSSGADRYVTSAAAARYAVNAGAHAWHTAPSGTAGNTITFTQAMTLDASGNLLVGTTSSDGSRLRVYGAYQTLGDGAYEGLIGKASSLVSGGAASDFAVRSAANIVFATNGNTERMRIDSAGNTLNVSTGGLGYGTGSGGTVTQATSRTTGVTLNKTNGAITLVSAAGTTTWQSFAVTNSTVAATDTVIINQKTGTTDINLVHVTSVAAGSFRVTFATTGGTTVEQPTFNFSVIKAVTA